MTTLVKVLSMVKMGNVGHGDNFGQKKKFGQFRPQNTLWQLRPQKETSASVGRKVDTGICRTEKNHPRFYTGTLRYF